MARTVGAALDALGKQGFGQRFEDDDGDSRPECPFQILRVKAGTVLG